MAKQKKSNFQQALDELLNGRPSESSSNMNEEKNTPVNEAVSAPAAAPVDPEPVAATPIAPVEPEPPAAAPVSHVRVVEPAAPVHNSVPVKTADPETSAALLRRTTLQERNADNLETVIQTDTIINGSIISKHRLNILGDVSGEVSTASDLKISGDVVGSVTVMGSLDMMGGVIEGPLSCKGDVHMNSSSLVLGDIVGKNVVVSGRVKGSITAEENLQILSDAVVLGDLEAETVQLQQGSTVNGKIIIRTKEKSFDDETLFARHK